MFDDNTLRCLMCVLKVCKIVSINIAQVLSQEKEEKQSSLRQPVLPGSPRYYRVFCCAELPGPIPDLQMLSGLARFNPVVAPVVARYYRVRSTTGPGGPVLPMRAWRRR